MKSTLVHPQERRAQFLWTAFILMFFLIQAVIWTVAISITSQDRSHAVVADYDQQALSWDEVKQAHAASDRLGWKANVVVEPSGNIQGERSVIVQLTDAEGNGVGSANVTLRAFHRAGAADRQQLTLVEVAPAKYAAKLQVQRFGKWCVSGTAQVDEQKFLFEETIPINKPTGESR